LKIRSKKMVNVELIYDNDCPNKERARAQLRAALTTVGLEPRWQEWLRSDARSPNYVKQYGSPTILVDGKDVGGALPGDGKSCRVYTDSNGNFSGVPSPKAIASALLKAKEDAARRGNRATAHTRRYHRVLAIFPAIGAVLIPGVSCPACWPAYAGLLSSLGLGFVNYTPYLFPLTLLCLAVAVLSLGFRARRRHGYGPLVLGFVGGAIILTGKFVLAWKVVTYVGVIFLVSACIWNLRPRKAISGGSCSDCVPAGALRTRPKLKGD
jgi:hypothetical protein